MIGVTELIDRQLAAIEQQVERLVAREHLTTRTRGDARRRILLDARTIEHPDPVAAAWRGTCPG